MANTIGFNPALTTNAAGSFSVRSDGLYQGVMLDSPTSLFQITSGLIASTETLPMWGGVAIFESIPLSSPFPLGSTIGRATNAPAIAGFSIFNQAHNGVTSPQSNVPTFSGSQTTNYVRLGSQVRVSVACPASLASLDGSATSVQVAWDLTNQQLIPFQTIAANNVATATTWSAGVASITTTSAHGLSTGAYVAITGSVPAGYNGTFQVTVTGASTFTYLLAVNPGTISTEGTVGATAVGILPVKLLAVSAGNSKTVTYDSVNNFANWNPSGSCALILI